MDALLFMCERRATLEAIQQADAVLDGIRQKILSIRKAHSRAAGDALWAFVCGMDFFRLCEYAQECPHSLRHEFCRMIRRQRGEL